MSSLCLVCRQRQERIESLRRETDTLERLVAECESQVGNARNKSDVITDPSPANRTDGEVAG